MLVGIQNEEGVKNTPISKKRKERGADSDNKPSKWRKLYGSILYDINSKNLFHF